MAQHSCPSSHHNVHIPTRKQRKKKGKGTSPLFKGIARNLNLSLLLQSHSVQFSHSVMSDSLQPHGLQYARPPCPSPTPGAYSNSCPLSWWCHLTISSSVIPFSSCLPSFPTSGSFFQWVSSSHQVAKVLEFQLQHQSFQWIFRTDFL